MSNDEIAGRLVVLETFVMTSLGLYLANARNDPDYSKAEALLDHLRSTASTLASSLPIAAKLSAEGYADQLILTLTENLRAMRGESTPH